MVLSCKQPEPKVCQLNLYCKSCELNELSEFNFSARESLSYAGSIKVEITAESSIPGEDSYLEYTIKSDDPRAIFIGPIPSKFAFLAIASIFDSEISGDPKERFGYHLMLGAGTSLGSTEPTWELG